jgi:hypothetical protein
VSEVELGVVERDLKAVGQRYGENRLNLTVNRNEGASLNFAAKGVASTGKYFRLRRQQPN